MRIVEGGGEFFLLTGRGKREERGSEGMDN